MTINRSRLFILFFTILLICAPGFLSPALAACIDTDGDGYGNPGDASCPKGNKTDCDNNDPKVYPGAAEICDGKDTNCDGYKPATDVDKDADGVPMCKTDCNDNNNKVYPGAPELCDGIDNNCDYSVPVNERDVDADGYRTCGVPADCNDNNRYINPGMQEWCSDTKDNNCNSQIDETPCICPDADNDGFIASYCGGTDCDDTMNTVYPGAPELCTDGKDNDCNGLKDCADPYAVNCPAITDADGDGYDIAGICGTRDCDDNDNKVYPGAAEICDGKDSNCDGWKAPTDKDADGDKVPVCAGDCNDNNSNINPLILERHIGDPLCGDGIDNDCDGRVDAADSGCAAGSCNTKTSPKDSPHFFTLLNPDNTVHPQNNALSCGKCHASDFSDPIRFACQRCHADPADTTDPLNGTTKAQYPLAPPYGYGTAPNVSMHSSSVVGTKYGSWTMGDKGCVTCHNPHAQEQNNVFGTDYGMFIKEYVCFNNPVTGLNLQEFVEFTSDMGSGSFADGPRHNENICEMCHTQTNHHQRDGSAPGGQSHYDSTKCTDCHTHTSGFKPGAAGQSHVTHLSGIKGPKLTCENGCHGTYSPPLFADGQNLASTSVCNNCHSPAGSYDGVNDPDTGAKSNWADGVYDGLNLKTGKELWCAGCHDESPGKSKIDGTGVSARNVIGNDTTYGFYVTGHGSDPRMECTSCHNASSYHIDHVYTPVAGVISDTENPTNYRFYDGKGMVFPYTNQHRDSDFALCYSCHDKNWYSDIAPPYTAQETNFREDALSNRNLHWQHVYKYNDHWSTNCVECHDPHGTTYTRMIGNTINLRLVNITRNAGDGKYYELFDTSKWDDPAYNHGGVLTQGLGCAFCHSGLPPALPVGPAEGMGYYLRQYRPHTYSVNMDIDNDGLADNMDNCSAVTNSSQTDGDGDGYGNVCDNCPAISNRDQADYDGDGIGDACDTVCDAYTQQWGKFAGTTAIDLFTGLHVDRNSNYIYSVGYSNGNLFGTSAGNHDMLILKSDTSGNQVWGRQYGDTGFDYLNGVTTDSSGNLYLAGYSNGALFGNATSTLDAIFMKYDANGNQLWGRRYNSTGENIGISVVTDTSGNAYFAGWNAQSGGYLAKYNTNGTLQSGWPKTFSTFYAHGIARDAGNNLYVAGFTVFEAYSPFFGTGDAVLVKFDTNGNQLWLRQFGTVYADAAFGVAVDPSGNVYVTGYTAGNLFSTSSGSNDVFIAKYDSAGTQLWGRQLGTPAEDRGLAITTDPSGYVYLAGKTEGGFDPYPKYGYTDAFIAKYYPDGDRHMIHQYGGWEYDYAYGIGVDNAGGKYVSGWARTFISGFTGYSAGADGYLLKFTESCP